MKEKVAAYLASQRETLIAQLTQKVKDLQISNEQWKAQVKELQVKVTDVTLLQQKHEKRKAATAALKVRLNPINLQHLDILGLRELW